MTAGNRRHQLSVQRRLGRQHDGGVGESPAIRIAAGKALDALFAKVGAAARRRRRQRSSPNGRIHVKGSLEGHDVEGRLQAARHRADLGRRPVGRRPVVGTGTSGVQFTEVDVDIETGIVKVKRILAMQDCGLIVDKLTAESQVYGGIIGSLNFALFEDRILDRNTGQMVNPNMEWYLLAGMSDIPKIDIVLDDSSRSAASSASASRRRCRRRRRSPTRSATRPARRSAACRCTRTRFCERSSSRKQEARSEGLRLRQSRRTRKTRSPRSERAAVGDAARGRAWTCWPG